MKTVRWICGVVLVATAGPGVRAQEPPKPGPEHETLKKMEGTWDATMKAAGTESKGTMVYKMELGGLWLVSNFEGEFAGTKFTGKGLDSYDAGKKKYVSVWVDNMITTPLVMEGSYDPEKKALTMSGPGAGPDGRPTTWKMVTTMADANAMNSAMYVGDQKEPAFTISYKRKK